MTATAIPGVGAAVLGATFVYVSNANDGDISTYRLEPSGELRPGARAKAAAGVGPMTVSPDRRFLYAASRSVPYTIHAYAIDRDTGALTPASTSTLAESLPYISLDRTGRFLLGASYAAGVVTVTAVRHDGSVASPALQVIPVGRNAHSIGVDRSNKFAYVPTLGSDAIFMFTFDADLGKLVSNTPAVCLTKPGAGPRHFVISGDNRFLFLLCEMTGTIVTFAVDCESGLLRETGSASGLSPDSTLVPGAPRGGPPTRNLERDIWAADIHATPNGKFLYISERTDSTLNAFGIDDATGNLTYLSSTPTEHQPRGFAIDPSGRFLVAAGEKSETISLYGIDAASGALDLRNRYPNAKGANWVEIVSVDPAMAPRST